MENYYWTIKNTNLIIVDDMDINHLKHVLKLIDEENKALENNNINSNHAE